MTMVKFTLQFSQYHPLQAQLAFPIDVLASLHRPRKTVCLAVRTSHLSCR